MKRNATAILALVLATIAFLGLNLAAASLLGTSRIDLTEARLYTLSPGTRQVLSALPEPVTLRLYVSRALVEADPGSATYAERVRELLSTYVRLGGGKLRVEAIDPEPFSAEEDRAVGFGLKGVTVSSAGDQGFFGLVGTNSTDDTDTIPFFTPEREAFLEYDLSKLVYNLANPKKPIVALIDGAQMGGSRANGYKPWAVLGQIKQFFDVRVVAADAPEIEAGTDVVLVVHPAALRAPTQYAIDQFVLGGGRALVFVDPACEEASPQGGEAMTLGAGPSSSTLKGLFEAWGVDFDPGKVVADRGQALKVQTVSRGRPVVADFLPYIQIRPPFLAAGDVVTGDLEQVTVMLAGAFAPRQGAKTTLTPLLQSSPDAALVSAAEVSTQPDPLALLARFQPAGKPLAIAARVTGPAETAFPNGPPEGAIPTTPAKPGETPPAQLKSAKQPINVILVGDVDMLSDRGWLETREGMGGQTVTVPFANNADFAVNALDNLTGAAPLIGLRGRGVTARPFTRVVAMQHEAEAQYRATERELTQKLQDTQRKVAGLQQESAEPGVAANDSALLSAQQQKAIGDFRAQLVQIRSDLRKVKLALRQGIERLESRIKLLDIVAVPALVALVAIGLAVARRRKLVRARLRSSRAGVRA